MWDYPPEFDGPDRCEVCAGWIGVGNRKGDDCQCPECPECTEVGNPECYDAGHMPKLGRAFNLADLAAHLGATRDDAASIARRLYKDTRCGISFYVYECGRWVSVAGYAEGSGDACCEPIEFCFPFDLSEFDKAVERADQEGCDLFDKFHCHLCGGETDYLSPCDECDTMTEED